MMGQRRREAEKEWGREQELPALESVVGLGHPFQELED